MQEKLVEIYFKPTCPYCQKALGLLHKKQNIKLQEINIIDNPSEREHMLDRANGRTTVPQIFINNEHIGGCDDLMMLESSGRLDKKLYD
ncbi:glutaredoxin 3 [Rickettsiales bacterium LUAb2]